MDLMPTKDHQFHLQGPPCTDDKFSVIQELTGSKNATLFLAILVFKANRFVLRHSPATAVPWARVLNPSLLHSLQHTIAPKGAPSADTTPSSMDYVMVSEEDGPPEEAPTWPREIGMGCPR